MTEQADIAAQLDASLPKVHVAFARVKQAIVDDDTLSALEGMADAIAALAAFAGAATRAVEVVGQQRDAARAEVDRLQAEVDRLRAWLPKWRKDKHNEWILAAEGKKTIACVYPSGDTWHRVVHARVVGGEDRPNLQQARASVEELLGLPECEVCDEP